MNLLKIDDDNKIYILDRNIYKKSIGLKNDCSEFIKNVIIFEESIKSLVERLENMARIVESEKLRVILLGIRRKE